MSRSTAVAPVDSALPELAATPATSVEFDDIALPSLYLAHRLSKAVGSGLVNVGDLFVAFGSDDEEPQVVYEKGGKEGVLFVPLHMYKTHTHSDGENLSSWPYGNGEPPAEAVQLAESTGKPLFKTYNYLVLLPDYDTELPVNFRLNSKSQRPAANKINLTVQRAGGRWFQYAFRATTKMVPRGNSDYPVPVIEQVNLSKDVAKTAEALFAQVAPGLQARAAATPSNLPGI